MGRKRLIGLITGVALIAPLPGGALEAGAPAPEAAVGEAGPDGAGEAISVPLPGIGRVDVSAQVDPDGNVVALAASVEVAPEHLPATTAPRVQVRVAETDGVAVDAAAPTTAGPVTVEPVGDVVAPAVDEVRTAVDAVAPGAVPDVRPAPKPRDSVIVDPVPGAPVPGVRTAATPHAGLREFDAAPGGTSVASRPRAEATVERAAERTTTPDEQAVVAAPRDLASSGAVPGFPDPSGTRMILQVLAAALVAATALANRLVARGTV